MWQFENVLSENNIVSILLRVKRILMQKFLSVCLKSESSEELSSFWSVIAFAWNPSIQEGDTGSLAQDRLGCLEGLKLVRDMRGPI